MEDMSPLVDSACLIDMLSREHRCAYLVVDRSFRTRSIGGYLHLFADQQPHIGDSLFDAFPELIGNEAILNAILAGNVSRLHLPHVNRDGAHGEVRYLDLLTLPHINAHGQIDGLVQTITDITDQSVIQQAHIQQRNELSLLKDRLSRQNVELARTNAELRRANRLKDEFLAGISHEVRTPLSAILGLAELLRAKIVGPLNDEQVEMLSRIEASGRHLLAVINDLLDLAKIEAGRFELEPRLVAAHQVCRSSLLMVKELALRKHQRVHINLDPKVEVLHADERRLRQALINLLSNAVKFTPPGGDVGLDLEGDPEQEIVRITVWDTGIGIAAEDIPRLFQPFSQIQNKYQHDQAGSGLGLVMVARLAELHGGGVSLVSEPGKGSRFTMTLPWTREYQQGAQMLTASDVDTAFPARTIPEADDLPLTGDHQHILLVDDDTTGSAIVGNYLQQCGYRVTHAVSGDEALALVRHELPDLAIIDLRLRGLDGLEVVRWLRQNIATGNLPIIVLTALAMPGDRERSLEAGANAYLSKPVRLRHLVKEIASLIKG
ncbi:histidine kinase [Roseiflexus castenholzii DSM 13941]|uniref:histidine kinase n=2 Tax=Roseiflexus castenholzii TaxID=120962 RepID=A7NQ03_ROSCS|nr:histidine kinase [Roseiflexus castenholzii DSM 13941]